MFAKVPISARPRPRAAGYPDCKDPSDHCDSQLRAENARLREKLKNAQFDRRHFAEYMYKEVTKLHTTELEKKSKENDRLTQRVEQLEAQVEELRCQMWAKGMGGSDGLKRKVRKLVSAFHPDRCKECNPTQVSQELTTLLSSI